MGITKLDLRLKAQDWFDRLEPEQRQEEDRKIEVKKNENLERIVRGYEKILNRPNKFGFGESVFEDSCSYAERIKGYSAEDIKLFSLILPGFENKEFTRYDKFRDGSGLYLSALIRHCPQEDVTLFLKGTQDYIWFVGYENNGKNIFIYGDRGEYIGKDMTKGFIKVFGNAGEGVGNRMSGGLIEVIGDVGAHVGEYMSGGKIKIEGEAGDDAGMNMEGGELDIFGSAGNSVALNMSGGRIFIEGSVGSSAGDALTSGKVIVNGNAGDRLGCYMQGGFIEVFGNVGAELGQIMRLGEIHIHGEYENICRNIFHKSIWEKNTSRRDVTCGNIYHKGKQIIKDGKAVRGANIKWEPQ